LRLSAAKGTFCRQITKSCTAQNAEYLYKMPKNRKKKCGLLFVSNFAQAWYAMPDMMAAMCETRA
jgi:hypothetical protein